MKNGVFLVCGMSVILACSTVAHASVEKVWFRPMQCLPTAEGGNHANLTGFLTIQTLKRGGAQLSIQLQKGAPRYEYVVKSLGVVLGTVTTNAKGNGSVTLYVADAGIALGQYVNARQSWGLRETDFETYGLLFGRRY